MARVYLPDTLEEFSSWSVTPTDAFSYFKRRIGLPASSQAYKDAYNAFKQRQTEYRRYLHAQRENKRPAQPPGEWDRATSFAAPAAAGSERKDQPASPSPLESPRAALSPAEPPRRKPPPLPASAEIKTILLPTTVDEFRDIFVNIAGKFRFEKQDQTIPNYWKGATGWRGSVGDAQVKQSYQDFKAIAEQYFNEVYLPAGGRPRIKPQEWQLGEEPPEAEESDVGEDEPAEEEGFVSAVEEEEEEEKKAESKAPALPFPWTNDEKEWLDDNTGKTLRNIEEKLPPKDYVSKSLLQQADSFVQLLRSVWPANPNLASQEQEWFEAFWQLVFQAKPKTSQPTKFKPFVLADNSSIETFVNQFRAGQLNKGQLELYVRDWFEHQIPPSKQEQPSKYRQRFLDWYTNEVVPHWLRTKLPVQEHELSQLHRELDTLEKAYDWIVKHTTKEFRDTLDDSDVRAWFKLVRDYKASPGFFGTVAQGARDLGGFVKRGLGLATGEDLVAEQKADPFQTEEAGSQQAREQLEQLRAEIAREEADRPHRVHRARPVGVSERLQDNIAKFKKIFKLDEPSPEDWQLQSRTIYEPLERVQQDRLAFDQRSDDEQKILVDFYRYVLSYLSKHRDQWTIEFVQHLKAFGLVHVFHEDPELKEQVLDNSKHSKFPVSDEVLRFFQRPKGEAVRYLFEKALSVEEKTLSTKAEKQQPTELANWMGENVQTLQRMFAEDAWLSLADGDLVAINEKTNGLLSLVIYGLCSVAGIVREKLSNGKCGLEPDGEESELLGAKTAKNFVLFLRRFQTILNVTPVDGNWDTLAAKVENQNTGG